MTEVDEKEFWSRNYGLDKAINFLCIINGTQICTQLLSQYKNVRKSVNKETSLKTIV